MGKKKGFAANVKGGKGQRNERKMKKRRPSSIGRQNANSIAAKRGLDLTEEGEDVQGRNYPEG